jgi:hypothetical protein
MLLPLFENDFALAKVVPKPAEITNTTTVAIAMANVVHPLYLFEMLLTYWLDAPKVSSTSSISEVLRNTC